MSLIPPNASSASVQDAYQAYTALQKAWADCPALADDPRFAAMRNEAYDDFRRLFDGANA